MTDWDFATVLGNERLHRPVEALQCRRVLLKITNLSTFTVILYGINEEIWTVSKRAEKQLN